MKELEDLTDAERSVLMMSYLTLGKSLHCHQPKESILNRIIKMDPKLKKKAFNKLITNGFLRKQPTGRSTTYELTRKGLKAADKHIRDNFNNL